jgi:leucyl/phenylalanyl-tRNA--protein transferase
VHATGGGYCRGAPFTFAATCVQYIVVPWLEARRLKNALPALLHLQCRIERQAMALMHRHTQCANFRSPKFDLRPMSSLFPNPDSADSYGLVSIGGNLDPERLLDAYRHGIFPWPLIPGVRKMQWWSPDPRAIFELNQFRVSHRLARTIRSGKFTVTSDRDFAAVIRGCATAQTRRWSTWLTAEMIQAYERLHELGHAHSIEVWHESRLAGGTYGVAIGGLYAGESMFYVVRDASKVALAHLVNHLRDRGYQLFDIQQLTDHSQSLGAIEIPRRQYLDRLNDALIRQVEFGAVSSDLR